MRDPETLDQFIAYLEACDTATRSDPNSALRLAEKAATHLKTLELSDYLSRNFAMRADAALGDALAATGDRRQAAQTFDRAKQIRATDAERASLAIRLARFYSEEERWEEALAEAQIAVKQFQKQRPRYETDMRSLSGALVARGNVFFLAYIEGAIISASTTTSILIDQAERDYRRALKCASSRAQFCVVAALSNLCNLSLRSWWENGDRLIQPARLAHEMRKVCTHLTKKGIRHGSATHAKARALYGLASVEAYGGLNPSNESRLERAFRDLLDSCAIKDAAVLALDLGYCYLREGRWDDLLTTTVTVLHHPSATSLPPTWRQALSLWVTAIEHRQISRAISQTYKTIRGFCPEWGEAEEVPIPKCRYGDRSDTLGF